MDHDEKRRIEILKNIRIPPLYYSSTLENFVGEKHDEYVIRCRKWIDNPANLLLLGVPGCGKTHLAISVLKELYNRGFRNSKFISVPMLIREVKDTFRDNNYETELGIVRRYISYDALVLDDIGAENNTDYANETILIIIDSRINELKPTIFTTNLSLRQIENKLDPRIASRLNNSEIIKIDLPDYRNSG